MRERELTKKLIAQSNAGTGAADIVVTTCRMNAITLPIS